jgi:uncharacterized Fe-S cluster-containing radical SAM superfamily protein
MASSYTSKAFDGLNKVRWHVIGAWYGARARYRTFRISPTATRLLGPQYKRSRDSIEIDITYVCNLRCQNCNRSITQAPEKVHMPIEMIRDFVRDSIAQNKRWRSIRILGGEPTLHPRFIDIINELRQYRKFAPDCTIRVITNGYGKAVNAILRQIPSDVVIENSAKEGNVQPSFGPFNLAPADDPAFRSADYTNGCAIMKECGMGLNPTGYYQCAVAGGIDRVIGKNLGRAALPGDADDMADLSRDLCRLCGHFRDGHMIPSQLRPPLLEEKKSETWVRIYADWKQHKRSLREAE